MAVTNYKLTLTANGPVHIGSGRLYGKKDYFLQNGKMSILDAAKFSSLLTSSQLESYCKFLQSDSREGLQDYLNQHKLNDTADRAKAYQIDFQLSRARRGSCQYLDVFEFVKDAYGCPYVPGSSVKGMLRTAILTYIILNDHANHYLPLFDEMACRNSQGQKTAAKPLERQAFYREKPDPDNPAIKNDIMRYLSVSDSRPLATDDLVFVKKYDKFARTDDGGHKPRMGHLSDDAYYQGNELNIYRESLKPGTKIELNLSIDNRIDQYIRLDAGNLQSILRQSFELHNKCFSDYFDFKADSDSSKVFCYLGGGVDFDSKTVLNALLRDDSKRLEKISRILYSQFQSKVDAHIYSGLADRIKESGFEPRSMNAQYRGNGRLKKAKDDHRHWQDSQLGVSPHTLKLGKIGNRLYRMGLCSIEVLGLS